MRLLLMFMALNSAVAQKPVEQSHVTFEKNPKTAFWLSFGSTASMLALGSIVFDREKRNGHGVGFGKSALKPSVAIISTGLIVGPSLGLFYSKNDSTAIPHLLIRGLAGSGAIWSLEELLNFRWHGAKDFSLYYFLFPFFSAGVLSYAIEDITLAPRSAREHNKMIRMYPVYDLESKHVLLGMSMHF